MSLGRARGPFSHPDWFFEIKWDGFRSLVRVEQQRCKLISRNGNEFKSFSTLNAAITAELKGQSAVLDGEIVCLDDDGRTQFRELLFHRGEPRFIAFDLLWCDGEDLRNLPLCHRKQRLRSVIPLRGERLLFCDHVEHDGEGLFNLACESDLEGIVAKRKFDPYLEPHARWLKIRNQHYSQWIGREELFEGERGGTPDVQLWQVSALACENTEI
jgi:bifunctional non-homologous end joining protein LigD